jgi:hypothetical protein
MYYKNKAMLNSFLKIGILALILFNRRMPSNPTYLQLRNTNLAYVSQVPIKPIAHRKSKELCTYVKDNVLTSFTLYTIINECCKVILIYHNIYAEYHGNTTLNNFKMKNELEGIFLIANKSRNLTSLNPLASPATNSYQLNNVTKFIDYEILFASYNDTLQYKNKHFLKLFELYKTSFYKSIS